jgi:anti-sigma factor RsiW
MPRLQAYLDDELTPEVADAVARHLDLCRACGLEEEAYRAIMTALAAAGPSPEDDAPTLARLERFAEGLLGGGTPDHADHRPG